VLLLCDNLHRLDVATEAPAAAGGLEERVAALEEQVRALAEQVRTLGGG
jgi:polyhydroxyalkanoate synthesis regulator phasin